MKTTYVIPRNTCIECEPYVVIAGSKDPPPSPGIGFGEKEVEDWDAKRQSVWDDEW